MYKVNKDCKYWIIFKGTNDWKIITCKDIKDGPDSDSEDLENVILIKYADSMSETLVTGNIGAFLTEDGKTDGYYIITWISLVYTLQKDQICTSYDLPMIFKKGALVCDAI